MPCVRVWDMEDQSHPQISEMAKGHKFGIACVVGYMPQKNMVLNYSDILKCLFEEFLFTKGKE